MEWRDPEPVPVEGRTLDEIERDLLGLLEEGYQRQDLRLLAGSPSDPVGDLDVRWKPGTRFNGVLVI